MTAPQTLLIRAVVEDLASARAEVIRAGLASIGVTGAEASAKATAALTALDTALVRTALNARQVGAAAVEGAAVMEGAYRRVAGAQARANAAMGAGGAAAIRAGAAETAAAAATSGAEAGVAFGTRFRETAMETMKTLIGPLIAMFAIVKVAEFFKDAVKDAADADVQIRRVKANFGDASEEVLKFSETTANMFGYTAAKANQAAADYGDYFHGLSVGMEASAKMSADLVARTGDIAAYKNVDQAQVEAAIAAALRGRGQALLGLGIHIDAASIAQEAYTRGLIAHHGALTDTVKATAAYDIIMRQSAQAQGSFTGTQTELGRAQQQLTIAFSELSDRVGHALLPFLATLAGVVRDGVLPVFGAFFSVLDPVLKVISLLPRPILIAGAAFGALTLLRGPLAAMFTAVSIQALETAASLETLGLVGAATALEGLASVAEFLAGPWGIVILAVTAGLAAWIFSNNGAATAVKTHEDAVRGLSAALEQSNGLLTDDVRKTALDQLANATWGDGGRAKDLRTFADNAGVALGTLVDGELGVAGAAEKVNAAYEAQKEHLQGIIDAGTRSTTHGGIIYTEEARRAKDTLLILDQQNTAWLGYVDIQKDAEVQAEKDRKALEQTGQAAAGTSVAFSQLKDAVDATIGAVDQLAGRNASVEDALKAMRAAALSERSTFNIGQAGAVRLNADRVVRPDGSIDTRSSQGGQLYDTAAAQQRAIVDAAQTVYQDTLTKTGDVKAAREAANKVVDEGVKLLHDNTLAVLGNEDAVDRLLKHLGLFEPQKVVDLIVNTQVADTNLAKTKSLIDQVIGSASGAPAAGSTPATGAGSSAGALPSDTGLPPSGLRSGGTAINKGNNLIAGNASDNANQARTYTPFSTLPFTGAAWLDAANTAGAGYSSAVTRWAGNVYQAYTLSGIPNPGVQDFKDAFYRINLESSGNSGAINLSDRNAANGTPSKGLVQVIDPTFKAYALAGYDTNIWDPESNLLAGMNYSKHTYGSIHAGFSQGGPYDNGGYLMPGMNLSLSGLRKPEPVLTPEQWRIAEHAMLNQAGGGGRTVNITFHTGSIQVSGDMDAAAQQHLRERLRLILREEAERAL